MPIQKLLGAIQIYDIRRDDCTDGVEGESGMVVRGVKSVELRIAFSRQCYLTTKSGFGGY